MTVNTKFFQHPVVQTADQSENAIAFFAKVDTTIGSLRAVAETLCETIKQKTGPSEKYNKFKLTVEKLQEASLKAHDVNVTAQTGFSQYGPEESTHSNR